MKISKFLGFSLTSATLLMASGISAAQAQLTLKYSPWIAPNQAMNLVALKPWTEEVSRVTEGRVKIDYLPKTAGSPQAQLEVVQDGIADVVLLVTGFVPGRFELLELAELPLGGTDAEVTSPVLYEIYKEHLESKVNFGGAHVLTLFTGTPAQLVTSKATVRNIGDFAGLKLRTPTASTANLIASLGAVPVAKPSTELYELTTAGLVDGSFFSFESLFAYNLSDTLTKTTVFPGGFNTSVLALLINKDKWESISPKDRDAISEISGSKLARTFGAAQRASEEEARKRYEQLPNSVVEDANPQLIAELQAAITPFKQKWVEKARAKGLPNADSVLAEYRRKVKEAATRDKAL